MNYLHNSMNTYLFLLVATLGGFAGGAVFGVVFGMVASIFRNGPPVAVAIEQSWWWFAIGGLCMGLAWAVSRRIDLKNQRVQHS
jgi:hypothetical protein